MTVHDGMETYERSSDCRTLLADLRSLDAAVEPAQAMTSSRPDVGRFQIYVATGLGRRLVGAVSRDLTTDRQHGLFTRNVDGGARAEP
jgi:hypothetical protein